jgi:hypothetical protein
MLTLSILRWRMDARVKPGHDEGMNDELGEFLS